MINRRKYYLLLFALICQFAFAQKSANQWYFGSKAGLNFNYTPPQLLSNGALTTLEGCASISDDNGRLLFYTNGVSIANSQHEVMANGDDLLGDLSSTDNTIIVPLPESDQLYYVFTISAATSAIDAFSYSVVDMKLRNGLGEVVQKNALISDDAFEKLAAVRHCNKKDVWITVKQWNSADYKTFLLTKDGLNLTPVVSSMSLVITGFNINAIGALKFSSDGKKLVAMHALTNNVAQLMRFNNSTGILSDEVLFYPDGSAGPGGVVGAYGAAFSPDNNLLYISSRGSPPKRSLLYQFDISSHNANTILASRYILSSGNDWDAGGLQLGPDKKIYFTQWQSPSLGVINNPNTAGAGSNYQPNGIIFPAGSSLKFGLPNFIASDLDSSYAPYSFSWKPIACASLEVRFMLNNDVGIDSVKWSTSDGGSYNVWSPQHIFLQEGDYQVSVTIFKQDCGAASETITKTIRLRRNEHSANFLPDDTSFCGAVNYRILPQVDVDSYLWSTGERSNQIIVHSPGLYWLEISNEGCTYRDSINIISRSSSVFSLGADSVVCVNKPRILNAAVVGQSNYLWSNGGTANNITVNMPGRYWLKITNEWGCVSSDTITLAWGDCDIHIPSAFTPNGDGINDNFGLSTGISSALFSFYIYNRYGKLVFKTNDGFEKWDGRLKGKPSPGGVYVWMMTYKNKAGFVQTDKGTVNLIR